MENKDFDAVYFVMAHEFGHQYCKHPTFHYSLLTFVGRLIPVFGPLLSRSQEYSADRIAQLLMDNDCVDKAMTLIAGRHLYKYIHARDYIDDEENQKGLFMWIVNLTASHPVMPKRIAALADPQKKSGKLF
jgi:Zn-dependent protease with chaperone function